MEFCSIDKYEDLIGQENKIIPYLMSLRDKKLYKQTVLDSAYIVRALIPKEVIHGHYDAREDYSKRR